ncbi:hypothetical protein EDB81DRAFT_894851 [Dactylonectria macrodidyma]|uniref:Uncharacterized protein n=1 Tax=Dactylonectria macrodidyma TaxID=307937 RepID=A0A9P9D0M5_9HYPO|nr:hypothetical protein EDB81DRAFT_894851 [Dactylonectria macrodidyma]
MLPMSKHATTAASACLLIVIFSQFALRPCCFSFLSSHFRLEIFFFNLFAFSHQVTCRRRFARRPPAAPLRSKMTSRRSRRLALLWCAAARRRRLAALQRLRVARVSLFAGCPPAVHRAALAANQRARAEHDAARRHATNALSGDVSLVPEANGPDFVDDDDDDFEAPPDTDSGIEE